MYKKNLEHNFTYKKNSLTYNNKTTQTLMVKHYICKFEEDREERRWRIWWQKEEMNE